MNLKCLNHQRRDKRLFLEGTALFLSVLQQRVDCFLGPFEFLAIWMREAFRAFYWDTNGKYLMAAFSLPIFHEISPAR
ncbi:hypothetical protein P4576_10955 [Peribacillus frigoritolerans]|uniref:hypothetical protein n=1 Tax=Peribacillus frigoritolerans TaxID=450367 RepID=UPI002E1DEA17|nr:hypothetical protein [Peribacillus frigoritolerans]